MSESSGGAGQLLVWDGNELVAIAPDGNPASAVLRVAGDGIDRTLALIPAFGTGPPIYLHQAANGSTFAATGDDGLMPGADS